MGLLDNTFLGTKAPSNDQGDYIELSESNLQAPEQNIDGTIHLADIRGQRDVMAIKDALYSGDIVIADLDHAEGAEMNLERVRNELQGTVREVDGDIVKDGVNQQLILTPPGVRISREKLE